MFALHVQLAFVTKYRRAVFTDAYLTAMQPVLADMRVGVGAALVECNGEDDHVHPLVSTRPPSPRPS